MAKINILHKIVFNVYRYKMPQVRIWISYGRSSLRRIQRELREKMLAYQKQKDDEIRKQKEEIDKKEKTLLDTIARNEQEFARKLSEEKNKVRQSLEEDLRKSIAGDFENQLKVLKESNQQNDEKLKEARRKELEFLEKNRT